MFPFIMLSILFVLPDFCRSVPWKLWATCWTLLWS